jgi:hypothetical protein
VSTDSGSETTGDSSSDVFVVNVVNVVNVVTDATSTTDTSLVAGGADIGFAFGCTAEVVSAAGSLALTSLPSDGALTTDRFGFFGIVAAAEKSEPDFLSLAVDSVDFLLPSLSSLPEAASSPASLSVPSAPDPASSPPDSPDDSDDERSFEPDPSFEPDEELEDSESDDELVGPESDGPAHATPGVVATATPTPKATAKPPTRPTYLA